LDLISENEAALGWGIIADAIFLNDMYVTKSQKNKHQG